LGGVIDPAGNPIKPRFNVGFFFFRASSPRIAVVLAAGKDKDKGQGAEP
jgi:hypothetical protein